MVPEISVVGGRAVREAAGCPVRESHYGISREGGVREEDVGGGGDGGAVEGGGLVEDPREGCGRGDGIEGGVGADFEFEERAGGKAGGGVEGERVEGVGGDGGGVGPIGAFEVEGDGDVVC